MHVSIFTKNLKPDIKCCTTCCKQYHCPICPKLKSFRLPRFARHLDVHVKNAIAFKDMSICRCNLQCRDVGHFHCPLCGRTIIRRIDREVHLKVCSSAQRLPTSAEPIQVIPSPDQPAASLPPSPSTAAPAPVASSPSPKAEPAPVAPSFSLAPSPQVTLTQVIPKPQDTITPKARSKMVKCPHCSLTLYRKNVPTHIQRKHTKQRKDITTHDHLRSVCVDATNYISAVKKTKHGFSVPVHVQNKTRHVHKVQCELEECRQYHIMAVGSELLSKHCEHIRSLQYCTDMAQEHIRSLQYCTDMAQEHIRSLQYCTDMAQEHMHSLGCTFTTDSHKTSQKTSPNQEL